MHPDVQEKAQQELDEVIGSNRLPVFADRASLPYVDAILRECLRWQPVAPIGVAHKPVTDDEYRGYLIPKDAIVMVNQWYTRHQSLTPSGSSLGFSSIRALLHDPETYPDPESFIPDRFIENGKLNPNVKDPKTIVFGFGRRYVTSECDAF